jgi:hypothetical protein
MGGGGANAATVTGSVPKLPLLLPSPPYVPVIVTAPAVAPVAVTEHESATRLHMPPELNVTEPAPAWVNVTVPMGEEPVMVAVQVEPAPTANEAGRHETEVVVAVRDPAIGE